MASTLLLLCFNGCKNDGTSTNADQFTDKLSREPGLNASNLFSAQQPPAPASSLPEPRQRLHAISQ